MSRAKRPYVRRQEPVKGKETITPEMEAKIQEVKAAYLRGEYKSINSAAILGKVPGSTLRRRILNLTVSKKAAHVNQQLLTQAEKLALVDWIKYLAFAAHPLNKRTIRPKVQAILQAKNSPFAGQPKFPSTTWIRTFMQENATNLKLTRGSGLDPKRARAFNFTEVQKHFALLKEHLETKNIPWRNVYNMDEKGIQMGGGRKGVQTKYFFAKDDKMQYKMQSDDLQLVTVIDCVCADGTAPIGPGFVFPGVTKHAEWFGEPDVKYLVATSENGWTDDEIGFQWFKQTFVPQAKERNRVMTEEEVRTRAAQSHNQGGDTEISREEDPPILLIFDGHGSHTTLEWVEYARANNVHLFCLIPHTTHRMQPLDVGCFGPLQTAWFNKCNEILDLTGEGMEMKDVVTEYFAARRTSFKPETISQAWRKSGIYPLNANIFNEVDFAPSQTTSTSFHAPESFPTRMPHIPEASSDDANFDPGQWDAVSSEEDDDTSSGSDPESDSDSELSESEASGTGNYTIDPEDFPVFPDTPQHDNHPLPLPLPTLRRPVQISDTTTTHAPSALTLSHPTPVVHESGGTHHTNASITSPTPLHPLSLPGALTAFSRQTRSQVSWASPTSTPSSRSLTPATPGPNPFLPKLPLSAELAAADARIAALTQELGFMTAQRDAAEVHAIFAMREATRYKFHLNKKKSKDSANAPSARRFHTSSHIVTNDQGLTDALADREKQVASKKKKDDRIAGKAAKEREDLRRRAVEGSTRVFAGSLNSKNKPELEDLADALGLPIDGKKDVIKERIILFFDSNPMKKADDRYVAVFTRSRSRKRAGQDDEQGEGADAEPAPQRRRLDSAPMQVPTPSLTPPVNAITGPSRFHGPPPLPLFSAQEQLPQHNFHHYTPQVMGHMSFYNQYQFS